MRVISLLLAGILAGNGFAFAGQAGAGTGTPQNQPQQRPQVDKVRAELQKRGTGEKAQVRVTLTSGSEVKGYISTIQESSFTVTNKKTGQVTTISYADTRNVRGPGLSKGAKIGIVVAIGIGVTAAVIAAEACHSVVRC